MWKNVLFVGVGGFLGAICRYLIGLMMISINKTPFPFGTFTVNILGSFLLGFLFTLALPDQIAANRVKLLFGIGFCGSFTTFSTFMLENQQLWTGEIKFQAVFYLISSLTIGIIALLLGMKLGEIL